MIYENFISFFHFSEIKRERLRESQREKERNTLREGRREHRAPSTRAEAKRSAICDLRSAICDLRSAICDLRSAICDEGRAMTTTTSELRQRDHGLLGLVCWGLVLVFVWGIFFFFFDKHPCVWFAGVCFAFALYRQYWGLISLPET